MSSYGIIEVLEKALGIFHYKIVLRMVVLLLNILRTNTILKYWVLMVNLWEEW